MNKNIFIILVSASALIYGCSDDKAADKTPATPAAAPQYTLATAEKRSVEQVYKLPAQLAAYQEVSIFPKVNGYVKSVLVDIGSHVAAGQLLMVLEDPELEQAAAQAREKYYQTVSSYTISRENYERLRQASKTPGAISPMDLATARSKTEADSALCNAEKAAWQQQQVMLAYLKVTAPFKGVITQRNVHPGALVSAEGKDGKPMLELKDVDRLRLQVSIPESMAGTLRGNDTISFYLSSFPGKRFVGHIARKSMNINQQYRSEPVELDVYNQDEKLSPGMYADVLFDSKGNPNALAVPKTAVVTSTERKYVIVIRDGKTARVDVSTGNEGSSLIEVLGDLRPGDQVVASANDEIKEGVALK
ncbi:MAG TPA: efflux RND transporter periplasmic adaptor subunit [Puia sp.]|uniref:efflux RND transporter periplasmic adaptor subunit n=1 Tax=Puia sp. TaxID=2045100 RepID=UPI002BE22736|nr:efflux RND transporter periplasmic adaptor subunit [Puia sp.]HVU99068.1 efflux RND transporter periplasmic adaptor subunit [Puia sp.]